MDINELRSRRKELQARFFPNKPVTVPKPQPAWIVPTKAEEDPVPKDIVVDPLFEPMEAEEFARKIRRGEFPKSKANYVRLIEKLSVDLGVEFEKIMSGDRTIKVARARMYMYWYLRRKMKLSWKMIGYLLKRDHSTVVSGVHRFEGNARDRRLKKDAA